MRVKIQEVEMNSGDVSACPASTTFDQTDRNRLKRRHDRGSYDSAVIYPILDSALLCHVSYVIDGQPYCTPTGFWREGDDVYWHGSSASRMLREQSKGIDVCLTVTHMDGLVLARSGFNHSINYRSAMLFGKANRIEQKEQKARALDAFVDRFFPGRSETTRKASVQEAKATSILWMKIEQASAKIRAAPPMDDDEDYSIPVWAGVVPIHTTIGSLIPCARMNGEIAPGIDIADYAEGAAVSDVFAKTYKRVFG